MASAGKVLMIVENQIPIDIRVWQEAKSLKKAGHSVDIICIQIEEDEKRTETIDGIDVYRIPMARAGRGSTSYILEYMYFTAMALIFSFYVRLKRGFQVVHAHNPPDTLFMVGLSFKPSGIKFVFDHHDVSPELYISRLGKKSSIIHRVLIVLEKLSCAMASAVVATNNSYKEIEMRRDGVPENEIFVVRNGPDFGRLRLLEPDPKLRSTGKRILGFVGNINPQDGVDVLLRAMHHLVYELDKRNVLLFIIGKGDAVPDLKKLQKELRLEDFVQFLGRLPDEEMLRWLSAADICVSPDPSSPLNDVSTWIKIMEYMTLKKPIVAFDLKETKFSAQEAAVYAKPNDPKDFANKIASLLNDEESRRRMGEFGRKRVEEHLAWRHSERELLRMYSQLLNG
jgi:glycosyltransferase involved in cell wall biosynthesis